MNVCDLFATNKYINLICLTETEIKMHSICNVTIYFHAYKVICHHNNELNNTDNKFNCIALRISSRKLYKSSFQLFHHWNQPVLIHKIGFLFHALLFYCIRFFLCCRLTIYIIWLKLHCSTIKPILFYVAVYKFRFLFSKFNFHLMKTYNNIIDSAPMFNIFKQQFEKLKWLFLHLYVM